ncbi:MAG: protoporphyrinogen oxidase, partial [bacterium]
SADVVICAAPAFVTSRIVHSLSASLSSSLDKIFYPPVTEVFLGFRADQISRPLDGFGFLVPAVEKRKILGTLWSSSLFPHRAPEGHVALTTFVGGSRQPELSGLQDDEIVRMVTEELRSIMGVAGVPVFSKIIRWQKAIPQYNLGHDVILKEIEKCELENQGLFFCSNFRGGIAVGDCVMSGKKVAEKVVADFKLLGAKRNIALQTG